MSNFGSPDSAGTAKFISMIDKFFDCLNVRKRKEHLEKMKPFLKPYDSVDNPRFDWLKNLLVYFDQWNKSIEERPASFSQNAKSRMFISWQTYEGFQRSVYSSVEVCKFLLQNDVQYVLSERFCQDDLENYFGRQRACYWLSSNNPTIRDVGYKDNTIKTQVSVHPIAGQ